MILARKAITTRYLGPTNTRGSRIRAYDEDGNSITLHWDHRTDGVGNAALAAVALCQKMKWPGKLAIGAQRAGYVFVFVDKESTIKNPTKRQK